MNMLCQTFNKLKNDITKLACIQQVPHLYTLDYFGFCSLIIHVMEYSFYAKLFSVLIWLERWISISNCAFQIIRCSVSTQIRNSWHFKAPWIIKCNQMTLTRGLFLTLCIHPRNDHDQWSMKCSTFEQVPNRYIEYDIIRAYQVARNMMR